MLWLHTVASLIGSHLMSGNFYTFSFDMNRTAKIFITLFIIFLIGLFVRGFYLDKKMLKISVNGIVTEKRKGSKGSQIVDIRNSMTNSITELLFPPFDKTYFFDKVNVNDSVFKYPNSYFVSFYRKGEKYVLVDSFEVYHY